MDCDFQTSIFARIPVGGELCSNVCSATAGCTHFSWDKSCNLRRGKVSRQMAAPSNSSAVCGLLSVKWNLGQDFAFGCEFDANATYDAMTLGFKECADVCSSTPECTKYSWKWDGSIGDCQLQQGEAVKEEALYVSGNNAACGIASNSTRIDAGKPYRNLGML